MAIRVRNQKFENWLHFAIWTEAELIQLCAGYDPHQKNDAEAKARFEAEIIKQVDQKIIRAIEAGELKHISGRFDKDSEALSCRFKMLDAIKWASPKFPYFPFELVDEIETSKLVGIAPKFSDAKPEQKTMNLPEEGTTESVKSNVDAQVNYDSFLLKRVIGTIALALVEAKGKQLIHGKKPNVAAIAREMTVILDSISGLSVRGLSDTNLREIIGESLSILTSVRDVPDN